MTNLVLAGWNLPEVSRRWPGGMGVALGQRARARPATWHTAGLDSTVRLYGRRSRRTRCESLASVSGSMVESRESHHDRGAGVRG